MPVDRRLIAAFPEARYDVPESRVFTFPTRLADTYTPDGLEIVKPAVTIKLPAWELHMVRGRSSDLPYAQELSTKRRLFMKHTRPLIERSGPLVDLRYEAHENISHLITFAAPLLLLASTRLGSKVRVLLKKRTSRVSLAVLAELGFEVVCTDHDVEGDFVVGPDGHDRMYEPLYSELLGPIGEAYVKRATGSGDRMFLSRRDTRRIRNSAEIEEVLKPLGFRTVYFEDHTIGEQWQLAAQASVVVAIHGAALGSTVFNRRRVKLVEVFHPGFSVDFFRRLAHLVGGSWCGVFGEMPADFVQRLDRDGDTAAYHPRPGRSGSNHVWPESISRALRYLGVTDR